MLASLEDGLICTLRPSGEVKVLPSTRERSNWIHYFPVSFFTQHNANWFWLIFRQLHKCNKLPRFPELRIDLKVNGLSHIITPIVSKMTISFPSVCTGLWCAYLCKTSSWHPPASFWDVSGLWHACHSPRHSRRWPHSHRTGTGAERGKPRPVPVPPTWTWCPGVPHPGGFYLPILSTWPEYLVSSSFSVI